MAQGYSVPFPPRLLTSAGLPADGWTIDTYEAGTTTPLETFSNPTLTSSNGTTITTNSAGYFRAYVAAGVLVKALVFDDLGNPQDDPSFDNELPMIDVTGGSGSVTAVPTGTVVWSPYSTEPPGFLTLDGSIVSRATFSGLNALAAADGYPNGAGDGMTTFALADLRGRAPYGLAASGTGSTLGATFGAIDHTHNGPSHTHGVTVKRDGWGSALNNPSATGRLNVGDAAGTGNLASSYQPSADLTVTSEAGGTGATSTANPPGITGYWFIKT